MPDTEDIWGIAAIVIGCALYLWRNKRKFDRTNKAGIERFGSYSGKLSARIGDGILWAVAIVSVVSGVIGLAVVHESTWGWVVLFPLICVVIYFFFFAGPK